jgi:hypothetical protein
MQAVGEYFRRLVGAVEVRVVPRYCVRRRTAVCVHIHPQNRPGEITAFKQTQKKKEKPFKVNYLIITGLTFSSKVTFQG